MRPRFLCLAFAFLSAALCGSAQTPPVAFNGPTGPATPPTPTVPGPGLPGIAPGTIAAPANTDDALINGLTLSDAPIDSVLQLLESFTGRTILRPQALQAATYSISITHPLPKSEAVLALETLLGLNGVGVVPLGDKFLKIVNLSQASREAPQMIAGSTLDLPPSGRVAAKLFQLQFLNVNEIIPPLQQIMSPGVGTPPVTFPSANAALIVDSISNLQRIELLLKNIDQPLAANLTPKFYTIHNTKASDLVNKLHAVFQGPLQTQLGSATTFTADDRTNQIILISDSRQYPFFDGLIDKLDLASAPNTHIEVIYLKHAVAKDVAPIISALISGQNSAVEKSGQAPVTPGQPNQPPRPTLTLNSLGVKDEGTSEFSNLVTVQSDDRTNAIIVSGTGDDIRLIQKLVDKIDILLRQVSIQVIIAEVSLTNSETSGISALNLTGATDSHGVKIASFDTGTSSSPAVNGLAGWAVSVSKVSPLAFTAALQNTGQNSNVKILSADSITTVHAKEADFQVTQEQPIITGSTATPTVAATTTSTGFSTSSTVSYKDIGIEVKVTPLIGNDGSVFLTIDQKVDDVVSNVTIDGNTQPIIGHREATSFVNVQDGEMVVLGGLQQSKKTLARTKLGFFYEIPVLSNLLGQHNNEVDRTELLFFVRPHVIPPSEGTADTNKNINDLSSKDQVNDFLQDPKKMAKPPTLLDRFYK
jgi:general secretion pathway protein D